MCLRFRRQLRRRSLKFSIVRNSPPPFSRRRRERFLRILREAAIWFDPVVRVADCRDAKDNKYLELALAAGAEMLVSSDDDLLVLDPWRGVRILLPADYLANPTISSA